jgi:hypothetical protein
LRRRWPTPEYSIHVWCGVRDAGFSTRHCQSTWAGREGVPIPLDGAQSGMGCFHFEGVRGGAAAHGVMVTFVVWLARVVWPEGVWQWQKR